MLLFGSVFSNTARNDKSDVPRYVSERERESARARESGREGEGERELEGARARERER
jgi:hypothetical protein